MDKLLCIGHITKDKIITPNITTYNAGGTAFYFAHALQSLPKQVDFELVTKGNDEINKAVLGLQNKGVKVKKLSSANTVYFENTYGENANERKQRVLAKADPFSFEEMEQLSADIFHVGALLNDDFSTQTLELLASKGRLSIDAQGFLRQLNGNKVLPIAWKDAQKVLAFTHTLKVNEEEMAVLSNKKDAHQAARLFAEWGVKEVVITLGSEGSLIYSKEVFYEIKAPKAQQVVDATGCGDTYMACYLHQRAANKSIIESANLASALCTKKIEHQGALRLEDVQQVLG